MKILYKLMSASALVTTLFITGCEKQKSEVGPSAAITSQDGKTAKMVTPTINCGNGNTQTTINVSVTAGSTGMPAGFSLQWMSATAYALGSDGLSGTADDNTWYASEDLRLCKASFSGNANLSRYNLLAGETVTVKVGEFLFDNGASTNCGDALQCGTTYVFRVFAHATSTINKSDFTPNLSCSTLNCNTPISQCTYTQGYWKTHGPLPTGNNTNVWPQAVQANGLTLGSVTYSASQLQSIFNTPAAGNGLIALAHQLIAAKLNIANGADASTIIKSIADADLLIGALVAPPVGTGSLAPSATSALTGALGAYNEGAVGPGHCQ